MHLISMVCGLFSDPPQMQYFLHAQKEVKGTPQKTTHLESARALIFEHRSKNMKSLNTRLTALKAF